MTDYDLCIAWNWEHDKDFIMLLGEECHKFGISLFQITPDNITELYSPILNCEITFRAFWDRASDTDPRFLPIVELATDLSLYCINHHEQALRSHDKAIMHLTLIDAGLYTPYTIILPSYEEQPDIPDIDLSPIGKPFIIKPAHGGGGVGVVFKASSLPQVTAARKEYPGDKYLLQANIVPTCFDSRPAWFRVISFAGNIYPCWWDTHTHVYKQVTTSEENLYSLGPLRGIAATIARLSELDLFSTEIALTEAGIFVIVDYVNDQIDLRLQSKADDGVPDDIVHDITKCVPPLVASHCPR